MIPVILRGTLFSANLGLLLRDFASHSFPCCWWVSFGGRDGGGGGWAGGSGYSGTGASRSRDTSPGADSAQATRSGVASTATSALVP